MTAGRSFKDDSVSNHLVKNFCIFIFQNFLWNSAVIVFKEYISRAGLADGLLEADRVPQCSIVSKSKLKFSKCHLMRWWSVLFENQLMLTAAVGYKKGCKKKLLQKSQNLLFSENQLFRC